MKRIVVALGGNAILTDNPSAQAQQAALKSTAESLVDLVKTAKEPVQLIVTHGNGPQVGNLLLQQIDGSSAKNPAMPLDTVGAMTQGEIGFWLADALNNAFAQAGVNKDVTAIVTRTLVDATDPAFKQPTKPIGPFYTANEMHEMVAQHADWTFVEDAGRGYRRVVPSPKPISIVEAPAVSALNSTDQVIIAAGGGGIPVVTQAGRLTGVEAVIDKDFSAAKLAELADADELIILTAVKYVAVNFNQPNEQALGQVSVNQMETYLAEGQFPAGSMKPKVEAAISFVKQTGRPAVITSLDNVKGYLLNGDATIINQ